MDSSQTGIIEDNQWHAYEPSTHQDDALTRAVQTAFDQGYAKGKADTEKTLEIDVLKKQTEAQQQSNKLLAELIDRITLEKIAFTKELQDTCTTIIRKILENQIKTTILHDEEKMMVAINDVFSQLLPNEKITLFLNASQHNKISAILTEAHITVKVDNTLADTDFYIHQGAASINGRLSERLDIALSPLLDKTK